MLDLAWECGHSIIFPRYCWYCGQLIYLYANPNGGFAIFDELGPPWPKHCCSGVHQNNQKYSERIQSYKDKYDFLIPSHTAPSTHHTSKEFSGMVVKLWADSHPTASERKVDIYSGSSILKLDIRGEEPKVGEYIMGKWRLFNGKHYLGKWRKITVPENLPGIQYSSKEHIPLSEKTFREKMREIYESMKQSGEFENKGVLNSDQKIIAEDASPQNGIKKRRDKSQGASPNRRPSLEELLEMSLMQEKYFSAALLIMALFRKTPSHDMDKKQFHYFASLMLAIVEDLGLESIFFPEETDILSKKIRRYLLRNFNEDYTSALKLSELKCKLQGSSSLQKLWKSLRNKEGPYIEKLGEIIPFVKTTFTTLQKQLAR